MWEFGIWKEAGALSDDQGNRITYSQLEAEGDKLYSKIKRRCLVFSLCVNGAGSVIGYTSFINHKVVPVLLNAHLEEGLLKRLLHTYKPEYLWLPDERAGGFSGYKKVYTAYGYTLLLTGYQPQYALADKLALLLTTSGSTGSPKFVRQSYQNILENAKSIVRYLELGCTERPITTLPMNYTYGLSIINSHLLVGAELLLTEYTLMQREFWDFFTVNEATSFGGVPYTYEMLDKLHFFRRDCPSLRTMTQAGGKLSPELHKKFAKYALERGMKFVVMYGQTEATARMSYLPPEKSLEKYGSMGIAIPGGRFSLIDADGQEILEPGVVGELVYEGPNVTLGYAESPEDLLKGDERHGRLETGDMAMRDDEGYYYISGRKKRFLKLFGNRVNLDEIDRMIKDAFKGLECASTGMDDQMFLFITDARYCDGIRKFVAEKTGINPKAFKVTAVPCIPKNDAGKTMYKELEQYYRI